MSRPIFASRVRANPYGVFIINDYESTQIGTSPTGVAELSTSSTDNSVVQAYGNIYFNGGGVLHRYNENTDNWDVLYHPEGMSGTSRHTSGLYYLNINNVPHVCWIISKLGTISLTGIKYNLVTDTATEVTGNSTGTFSALAMKSILFGNSIYWLHDKLNLNSAVYNPGSNTIGGIASSPSASNQDGNKPQPVIWNGNLYTIMRIFGGAQVALMRLTGSTWTQVGAWSSDLTGVGTSHGAIVFTDRTNLYALWQIGDTSYRMYKVTPELVFSNITTPLGAEFAGAKSATRAWVYVDNEDDQDNPAIYLFVAFSETAGTPVAKYKWMGDSAPMELVGVGGDVAWSWSSSGEGAGHRSFTNNELDININSVDESALPGASRISFNVFESPTLPSGTMVNVKIAIDEDFEHPNMWASLVNPLPSGTIVNGDTITGIVADGSIDYTVDWRPSLDGIGSRQTVVLVPWVSGVV